MTGAGSGTRRTGRLRASPDRSTDTWAPDEMTSQRLTLEVPTGTATGKLRAASGSLPALRARASYPRRARAAPTSVASSRSARSRSPPGDPRSDRTARAALAMDAPPEALRAGGWRPARRGRLAASAHGGCAPRVRGRRSRRPGGDRQPDLRRRAGARDGLALGSGGRRTIRRPSSRARPERPQPRSRSRGARAADHAGGRG